MSYFFDTYALIELVKGNENYRFAENETLITSVMNITELYYALLLENKKEIADNVIKKLNMHLIEISSESAIEAALFRHKHKKLSLSYIDCLGYILASKNGLVFLTGDEGFRNLTNVRFVKK